MADAKDTFLKELCEYHISGQLRVAPEHVSDAVLDAMGKPKNEVYENFLKRYAKVNRLTGKQQYAVSFQVFRQTDHGHLLLIHGNAVALQKHHDGQQKHDDHEKYRPEREAHVPAEQAQRVETPA